jgi:hypothetical protein
MFIGGATYEHFTGAQYNLIIPISLIIATLPLHSYRYLILGSTPYRHLLIFFTLLAAAAAA